jgi:hypothetical protein
MTDAPASIASWELSICSEMEIGTAGFISLVGSEPVIAQQRIQGFPAPSDVEKDCFIFSLKINIELIRGAFTRSDQRWNAVLVLNTVQQWILSIRDCLVIEIHAGAKPEINAARDDPKRDMWRLLPPIGPWRAAWLDRFKTIGTRDAVGRLPAPTGKARIWRAAIF